MDLTNFTADEARILIDKAIEKELHEILETVYANCAAGISTTQFEGFLDDYMRDRLIQKGFIVTTDTETDNFFFNIQVRGK
jgi:hypothetical protein